MIARSQVRSGRDAEAHKSDLVVLHISMPGTSESTAVGPKSSSSRFTKTLKFERAAMMREDRTTP